MKKKNRLMSGQSLIEVLIVAGVVGTILTAVAATLTYSVKNSAENKFRSVATTKAQEAVEVFRRERSFLGWETFNEVLGTGGVYCLNNLPLTTEQFIVLTPSPECTESVAEAGTEFSRQVSVTPTPNSVKVVAQVTWHDGDIVRNVSVTQELFQSTN